MPVTRRTEWLERENMRLNERRAQLNATSVRRHPTLDLNTVLRNPVNSARLLVDTQFDKLARVDGVVRRVAYPGMDIIGHRRKWFRAARRQEWQRRSAGLAAVVIAVVIAACGGGLSEQEYADLMCGPELLEGALYSETDDLESLTYAQMIEAVAGLLEKLESIEPPEVYEQHLQFVVIGQRNLLQALDNHPPGELFSVEALRPELSTYARLLTEALTGLPEAARERLHAAGCDQIVIW